MNNATSKQLLLELCDKAKHLHAEERRISLASIRLVGELEQKKAWYELGLNVENYAKFIGLSVNKYRKRLTAWRVVQKYPRAAELFLAGEIDMSHICLLSGKINDTNQNILFEGIRGKSKRDAESFASRVTADGRLLDKEGVTEFTVRLTDSQRKVFDRAREVLSHSGHVPTNSEIILQAAIDLLEKRDPLKKAERAASKTKPVQANSSSAENLLQRFPKVSSAKPIFEDLEIKTNEDRKEKISGDAKRKPISAKTRHAVWSRDKGKCTYIFEDGSRCDAKMMIEMDHKLMVCRGGDDSVENLRLRCRFHNQHQAEVELGRKIGRVG